MNTDAEYASLRQELIQCETYIVNISIFVMTVSGASLTAAFQLRNPIAALFPLFVLYLGNVIVFNNAQTIARIGTYIQIFWEEEHKEFHWETRQAKHRAIIEREEADTRGKRSGRWEEWMGPLAHRMFFVTGFLCIFVYAYISLVVLIKPQATDLITPFPYVNWAIFLYILLLSSVIWTLKWLSTRRRINLIHGRNSVVEQLRTTWQHVKENESSKRRANTG